MLILNGVLVNLYCFLSRMPMNKVSNLGVSTGGAGMPSIDCATDTELVDSQGVAAAHAPDGDSKPLKGLFYGFAATVTIGLALASWYVGVRIVAAQETVPQSTAPVAPPSPPAPAPSVAAPAQNEQSMAEAFWYSVPPPDDLFLQVAGLGPTEDTGFVTSLQAKGFHAQIRTEDRLDNARILIGPFSTHADLERAQRKLQSAGVLAIEAAH
jgi:cell division septation protein DedD